MARTLGGDMSTTKTDQAPATGDGNRVGSAKVPALTQDPYVERHAEIIARYHGGSLR